LLERKRAQAAGIRQNSTRPKLWPEYERAFADYGVDVLALSVAEAAERIRPRAIRSELAQALDAWSRAVAVGPHGKASSKRFGEMRKHLRAVARAVDPDPQRGRLRDVMDGNRDRDFLKEFEAFANSPEVLRLPPRNLILLADQLSILSRRDGGQTGFDLLRKAQRKYPGDLWIHIELGTLCARHVQYEEAVRCFSAALALRPERWQTWSQRGYAFHALRQDELALADISQALDLTPANATLLQLRGRLHVALRQYEKAIADCTRALELDAMTRGVHFTRALAFEGLEQWQKAIADYTQALTLWPRDWQPLLGRGHVHAILGDWHKAADDTEEAVKLLIDPKPKEKLPGVRTRWAVVAIYRLQAGEIQEYRDTCKAMLDRLGHTKDPVIAQWVALACLLHPDSVKDARQAFPLAARLPSVAAPTAWRRLTRGMAYYRTGDYVAAARWLDVTRSLEMAALTASQKAKVGSAAPPPLSQRADAVACWLFRAMALHHLKDRDEARRLFDKAVKAMDQEMASKTRGRLSRDVRGWALCLIARREAEGLFKSVPRRP
jgi:tetratricopeptide (TPR) repeat protein